MKVTQPICDLLHKLRDLETEENLRLLSGDKAKLRMDLVRLYRTTSNLESHDIIVAIM